MQSAYRYPEELTSESRTPQEELTALAWQGTGQMSGNNFMQVKGMSADLDINAGRNGICYGG